MKDFENTIDLIICEYEHWLKMCEITNNDYDMGYFGARAIICENVIGRCKDKDIQNISELHEYLLSKFEENKGYQKEYVAENQCDSEKIQGYIDEDFFLLNMINQGPFNIN